MLGKRFFSIILAISFLSTYVDLSWSQASSSALSLCKTKISQVDDSEDLASSLPCHQMIDAESENEIEIILLPNVRNQKTISLVKVPTMSWIQAYLLDIEPEPPQKI